MDKLITIDPKPDFEPARASVPQERRIVGEPQLSTWAIDEAHDGHIKSGIWQATPGTSRSMKGETFEFCHILEGVVEVTEDGTDPVTYWAGDSFLMKPGFVGTWKTIETVKKIYVTVTP